MPVPDHQRQAIRLAARAAVESVGLHRRAHVDRVRGTRNELVEHRATAARRVAVERWRAATRAHD